MGKDVKDAEGGGQQLPYPKAVFFIIICEFCERFCFYGMRTVLTLYMVQVLNWTEDQSTVVYHVYVMAAYFTPLIGAMLADSLLGKFRTIFYLGVVYCAGCVVLTLAATPPIGLPTVAFSMLGLGLIALGTGGIKPCVSAFGADQFKLPEQEIQVASFFAMFYFSINAGSLVSTLLTPVLREDVKCFGDDHCYSLAFAVPGALMIVALIAFLFGRILYKINKPEGNVVVQLMKAIWYALTHRGKEIKAGRKRDHWLEYAEEKFGHRFIAEGKVVLKVLFLYLPVPLFWALFDQQGSRWTLQATRTDGNTFGWVIKPDQLQVVNPVLVLLFIPIFDKGVYPLLAKFGILKKPLQRLTVGGIFAGAAFIVSGVVELGLERTYATVLNPGQSNVHLFNGLPNCNLRVSNLDQLASEHFILGPNQMQPYEKILTGNYSVLITAIEDQNTGCVGVGNLNVTYDLKSQEAQSYLIYANLNGSLSYLKVKEPDDMEKASSGNPKMKVIYPDSGGNILPQTTLQGHNERRSFIYDLNPTTGHTDFGELEATKYDIFLTTSRNQTGFRVEADMDMRLGAVYVMTVVRTRELQAGEVDGPDNYLIGRHEITKANNIHMLLLLPQYIIMTIGEIMFSITIMDFSYAEAPPSMKSVMQSAWLMTVAFGNLIVVIIAEAKIFEQQWKEFFLFAGCMFAAMALFGFMAWKYEPADRVWLRDNENKDKKEGDENANNEKKELEQGKDNLALEDSKED